jgi:4-hydroxy-tetrahydrodipicolinate reductase
MKLKIGIAGISGRIGQRLVKLLEKDNSALVHCGLLSKNSSFRMDAVEINSNCAKADVWIDFSTPRAFEKVLAHCVQTNTPLVSGTTGLSKKHYNELEHASVHIPILWASNFAISINLIRHFLSNYSRFQSFDVSIIETHHVHKVDKPSGTAITLAKSIKPHGIIKRVDEDDFLFDDIQIKSVREGEVAGIHTVELDNEAESIRISHTAKDPQIFAQGAINVAKWLAQQEKGFYTMTDYVESLS